jgi:hypothetical protein
MRLMGFDSLLRSTGLGSERRRDSRYGRWNNELLLREIRNRVARACGVCVFCAVRLQMIDSLEEVKASRVTNIDTIPDRGPAFELGSRVVAPPMQRLTTSGPVLQTGVDSGQDVVRCLFPFLFVLCGCKCESRKTGAFCARTQKYIWC